MAPPQIDTSALLKAVESSNKKYTTVLTAWTDNMRGVTTGPAGAPVLSCFGSNITDQRLVSQDGVPIPFVRSENYDEHLGCVAPENLLCGDAGTFADLWRDLDAVLETMKLKLEGKPSVCGDVVVRLQNCFVSVEEGKTRQVAPANFSYQTSDVSDPCNLLLVVTPTGISVHTDGVGYTKLFSREAKDGEVLDSWYEAEKTDFAVGHAQTADGEKGPSSKKRARVASLGIEGSGARCGRMLIFSVPLKQQPRPPTRSCYLPEWGLFRSLGVDNGDDDATFRSLCAGAPVVGLARAARLNVGDEAGRRPLPEGEPKTLTVDERHPVVCTQIDYNVLVGKEWQTLTISEETAEFVVKDMDRQYALCGEGKHGPLSTVYKCLKKLTIEDKQKIAETFKACATAQAPTSATSSFAGADAMRLALQSPA
jgi:hypothetical protein